MTAEPNTYVQTISIADSGDDEETLLCVCGCSTQTTYLGKMNCFRCGAYIQRGSPPIVVSNLLTKSSGIEAA